MRVLAAAVALLAAAPVLAHPLAPALLELRETEPGVYAVQWRTSVARVGRAEVEPRLPCPAQAQGVSGDGEALVARWRMDCGAQGLAGRTVEVSGLAESRINVIVRHEARDGAVAQALLDAAAPRHAFAAHAAPGQAFGEYASLGARHLLGGADHVLFILGLLLLVRGGRALLLTVTGFTLGHSLTLALASLGLLRLDPDLAELGIALSLVWLGVQLARPGVTAQPRAWSLALPFGLLHGLGFAGALQLAGLPAGEVWLPLLAFNLGIEAGQLGIVAAALVLARVARPLSPSGRAAAAAPAYVIGSVAALWCIERTVALLA
jgi:hypothetical protein